MHSKFDILSIGSCYLDINTYDFSFEDNGFDIETMTIGGRLEILPGGSALNFVQHSKNLGMRSVFLGKIGDDHMGETLSKLLKGEDIKYELIKDPQVQTNLGINFTNPKDQVIKMAVGTANQSLTASEVIFHTKKYISEVKYLYLGGYFKLKAVREALPELINLAHRNNASIIFDHGRVVTTSSKNALYTLKQLLSQMKSKDCYMPNLTEAKQVWGGDTPDKIINQIRKENSISVVIKQDKNGAVGINGNSVTHHPSFKVNVVNTIGAGDAFNAGFIKAQIDGKDFQESIKYANAFAAIKISQPGLPKESEVTKLYKS